MIAKEYERQRKTLVHQSSFLKQPNSLILYNFGILIRMLFRARLLQLGRGLYSKETLPSLIPKPSLHHAIVINLLQVVVKLMEDLVCTDT